MLLLLLLLLCVVCPVVCCVLGVRVDVGVVFTGLYDTKLGMTDL